MRGRREGRRRKERRDRDEDRKERRTKDQEQGHKRKDHDREEKKEKKDKKDKKEKEDEKKTKKSKNAACLERITSPCVDVDKTHQKTWSRTNKVNKADEERAAGHAKKDKAQAINFVLQTAHQRVIRSGSVYPFDPVLVMP